MKKKNPTKQQQEAATTRNNNNQKQTNNNNNQKQTTTTKNKQTTTTTTTKTTNKNKQQKQQYTTTYNGCGDTKYSLGDFKGAIEDYDQAITLDPKIPHIVIFVEVPNTNLKTTKEQLKIVIKQLNWIQNLLTLRLEEM